MNDIACRLPRFFRKRRDEVAFGRRNLRVGHHTRHGLPFIPAYPRLGVALVRRSRLHSAPRPRELSYRWSSLPLADRWPRLDPLGLSLRLWPWYMRVEVSQLLGAVRARPRCT